MDAGTPREEFNEAKENPTYEGWQKKINELEKQLDELYNKYRNDKLIMFTAGAVLGAVCFSKILPDIANVVEPMVEHMVVTTGVVLIGAGFLLFSPIFLIPIAVSQSAPVAFMTSVTGIDCEPIALNISCVATGVLYGCALTLIERTFASRETQRRENAAQEIAEPGMAISAS